ncbi:MAG: dihydroorotate dehydrogenase [Candidatus Omnitrophota bacterium]
MPNLSVKIGKLKLKNPVLVASGTFGYADEFSGLTDLKKLGAIVTKTITVEARRGNAPPRTCETPAGMLNSIGLENPGMERFIQEKLSLLNKIGVPIIVSIASEDDPGEFIMLAKRLDKIKEVAAIELNISCPNMQKTKLIAQDSSTTYAVVKGVRKVSKKTIITKLSPNVTDIVEIAKASQAAGADAVSLVNTFYGMGIDVNTKRPKLGNIIGGLSGPAIKPIALYMVREVYRKVKIPIIGMGGIMNTQDALEFIFAGASAVSIGTANFIKPAATIEIIQGLQNYLIKNKIKKVNSLVGSLKA